MLLKRGLLWHGPFLRIQVSIAFTRSRVVIRQRLLPERHKPIRLLIGFYDNGYRPLPENAWIYRWKSSLIPPNFQIEIDAQFCVF